VKYGRDNSDVVVLDADVSSSTRSALFREAFPERFFNVGVAEGNMAAMGAGFASVGKIPFINTFATFISTLGLLPARIFGSYSNLNIKFMGAYGGLSDAYDGPSHHSIEDLAIMRSLPNFRVYVVSDETLTDWVVKHAIESKGPMYVRLSRDAFPSVYKPGTIFEDGKGKVLREGKDATVVACGVMVGFALDAAKEFLSEGIEVTVIDMFTVKPLDADLLLESARSTGAVVVAEEHSVVGGLAGAVAEALVAGQAYVPAGFVGLPDCHAECGSYPELLKKYRLDVPSIAAKVRETVAKKR
jgi:transketolase